MSSIRTELFDVNVTVIKSLAAKVKQVYSSLVIQPFNIRK